MSKVVTLRLSDDELRKVLRFGLKSNKDIKNFILAKVDEDIKQATVVGLLREVLNELNETKKLLIVRLNDVAEVLESLKERQASSDSGQTTDRVIHVVYEMLKLFILNYTQLYQESVKQKVIAKLERLRDEV